MTDKQAVNALLQANKRLLAEARELPLGIAVTFLGVALWEDEEDADGSPLTLEDLAIRVGMSPTTISQHLRYLGENYRFGKPGLGLVETWENPHNRRKKIAGLTPKGNGLVRQLGLIIRRS